MTVWTVEFALPYGGTHKQRIRPRECRSHGDAIRLAMAACKRRGITVANVLSVRTRDLGELWSWQDQGTQFGWGYR